MIPMDVTGAGGFCTGTGEDPDTVWSGIGSFATAAASVVRLEKKREIRYRFEED